MARWQMISVIILLYLGVTLGIGLRAGKKASKSVTGYVAGAKSRSSRETKMRPLPSMSTSVA